MPDFVNVQIEMHVCQGGASNTDYPGSAICAVGAELEVIPALDTHGSLAVSLETQLLQRYGFIQQLNLAAPASAAGECCG